MSVKVNSVDKMERLVPEKAARAIKVAYRDALRKGNEVLVVRNGALVRVLPDEERVIVRPVAARIPVVRGTKYLLVAKKQP